MISDTENPFFKPLWRRLAIIAFCAGWTGFEFYHGNNSWGWITLAITGYAIWTFLVSYKADEDTASPPADEG